MESLFATGHAADLVLAVLCVECLVLAARPGAGPYLQRLAAYLRAGLPGICLVLALRAALTGADWRWIAVWLGLAFPAHLADLWKRHP